MDSYIALALQWRGNWTYSKSLLVTYYISTYFLSPHVGNTSVIPDMGTHSYSRDCHECFHERHFSAYRLPLRNIRKRRKKDL